MLSFFLSFFYAMSPASKANPALRHISRVPLLEEKVPGLFTWKETIQLREGAHQRNSYFQRGGSCRLKPSRNWQLRLKLRFRLRFRRVASCKLFLLGQSSSQMGTWDLGNKPSRAGTRRLISFTFYIFPIYSLVCWVDFQMRPRVSIKGCDRRSVGRPVTSSLSSVNSSRNQGITHLQAWWESPPSYHTASSSSTTAAATTTPQKPGRIVVPTGTCF